MIDPKVWLHEFHEIVDDFTPDQKESVLRTIFLSCIGKRKQQDHEKVIEQFHLSSGYFKTCDLIKKIGMEE